jgi:hypothetical protein
MKLRLFGELLLAAALLTGHGWLGHSRAQGNILRVGMLDFGGDEAGRQSWEPFYRNAQRCLLRPTASAARFHE